MMKLFAWTVIGVLVAGPAVAQAGGGNTTPPQSGTEQPNPSGINKGSSGTDKSGGSASPSMDRPGSSKSPAGHCPDGTTDLSKCPAGSDKDRAGGPQGKGNSDNK